MRRLLAPALALAALATMTTGADASGAGFGTGSCKLPAGAPMPGSGTVREVGAGKTYATIQAGVNAAVSGDTVLVHPGVYNEAVVVNKPYLRIRGTSRNGVILDGLTTAGIGISAQANGIVMENMTARRYRQHGFFWTNVTGYWGRYLSAYSMGLYGIFAYDARCGQFDHSYGSGNADSAFYIGECFPCDAVITDILAENNALGYSGTNAGGNLTLRDSVWDNNGMGIVPNSLNGEKEPPQRNATIMNNVVSNNNNATAPGTGLAGTFYGAGIVIAGGNGNTVVGNTVTGHKLAGIALAPLPDPSFEFPTTPLFIPSGNVVRGNTISGLPGSMDLAQGATSGPNNCYASNTFTTSAPAAIETVWLCRQTGTPPGGDPRVEQSLAEGVAGLNGRMQSPWQTYPAGPSYASQPNQPDDNGNASYLDDGGVDSWLPALGIA